MDNIDQASINDQQPDYLSAREAATFLGVKLATLYAYTSRDLVESIPGPSGRARLYRRRDLERLRARRDARAGHGPVAAAALRFGEPVLDSSITAISWEKGPLYRGESALALAASDRPFEAVAELLWGAAEESEADGRGIAERWREPDFGLAVAPLCALLPSSSPPVTALAAVVPLLASVDEGRFVERPEAVIPRARTLIRRMAAALALARGDDAVPRAIEASLDAPSIAAGVAAALDAAEGERGVAALIRALVRGADHELNASTFAARVAASTGSDIYACTAAALASLAGPRHGGASDRVEALVAQIGAPVEAEHVVHERQRRGEAIEGFGHPLYPGGDPRGRMLLDLAGEIGGDKVPVRTCLALTRAMEAGGAGEATIDVGLVALALALELPAGAAVGIFSIARSVGWVAHVLEQYEAGYLLRPRARYLGPD